MFNNDYSLADISAVTKNNDAGLAAEALGDRSYGANIRRTANGTGKSAYGFKWRWKE